MSICLSIRSEDSEVEDLLAFMGTRFCDSFISDRIYIMERAIKLLRIADEYAFKTDPYALNVISLQSDGVSLAQMLPIDKHPEPLSHS